MFCKKCNKRWAPSFEEWKTEMTIANNKRIPPDIDVARRYVAIYEADYEENCPSCKTENDETMFKVFKEKEK